MKILLTVTGSWGTGSFQVAHGVAKALLAEGQAVKIFFPDSHVPGADIDYYYGHPEYYEIWRYPLEENGVRLETFPLMLPDPNPRSPNAKTFNELTPDERSLYFSSLKKHLSQVIANFQPDVIECHHIWATGSVIDELHCPYISVAHNSDQLAFEFDPSMRKIATQSAINARFIFAVSDTVREKVIDFYGVEQDRVITIPCGYDPSIFKPMEFDREAILAAFNLKIPKTAQLICFSGKISRIKGFDVLLAANNYLPPERHIHLLVMGSGSIDELFTPEEKAKYCLDRVHLLGHRSLQEVAQINNISALNIVPSRSEGFCIAGLEAIACGTPVIMTDTASAGEYVAAAIVPSENSEALAKAIIDVLDLSDQKYAHLCENALTSAKQFTWDCIVKKRLVYYRKLIDVCC